MENSDKITIDELKVFLGTGLKISYPGQKVVGRKEIDGFLGPVMAAKLEDVLKVGEIRYIKFTKSSIWMGIGQSLHNCKSFDIGDNFKPIVRPCSHLTKEIDVDGERFVPSKILYPMFGDEEAEYMAGQLVSNLDPGTWPLNMANQLARWGFDIFNWLNRTGPDGQPLAVEMDG